MPCQSGHEHDQERGKPVQLEAEGRMCAPMAARLRTL
jgi:hypothetical protein